MKKKVNYLTPNQNAFRSKNETQTKDGFMEGKGNTEREIKLTYVKKAEKSHLIYI